ncbi:hypothetical protein PR048_027520 [Dryococelus australis]|uniref:Uncharacterized protein n=1 Tax=Dryococelus australis TaxID=614101 RepID=A0ABQ9GGQ9_9NEOP|nr:hypothetical protein PR048_027520 [Dryococelus australis]
MDQRRNVRAGRNGSSPRKSATSGIVRHESHLRKSGVNRPGIEPASAWWEASNLTAQSSRPPDRVECQWQISRSWPVQRQGSALLYGPRAPVMCLFATRVNKRLVQAAPPPPPPHYCSTSDLPRICGASREQSDLWKPAPRHAANTRREKDGAKQSQGGAASHNVTPTVNDIVRPTKTSILQITNKLKEQRLHCTTPYTKQHYTDTNTTQTQTSNTRRTPHENNRRASVSGEDGGVRVQGQRGKFTRRVTFLNAALPRWNLAPCSEQKARDETKQACRGMRNELNPGERLCFRSLQITFCSLRTAMKTIGERSGFPADFVPLGHGSPVCQDGSSVRRRTLVARSCVELRDLALNNEVLRADEERRREWSRAGMKGRRKREISQKTRQSAASDPAGDEPGSPWWEAVVPTLQGQVHLLIEDAHLIYSRQNAFRDCELASFGDFFYKRSTVAEVLHFTDRVLSMPVRQAVTTYSIENYSASIGSNHSLDYLFKKTSSSNNLSCKVEWREIRTALDIEDLRADEDEISAGMNGREKWEIPEKTRRQAASSGTIPTDANPGATPSGIEPAYTMIGVRVAPERAWGWMSPASRAFCLLLVFFPVLLGETRFHFTNNLPPETCCMAVLQTALWWFLSTVQVLLSTDTGDNITRDQRPVAPTRKVLNLREVLPLLHFSVQNREEENWSMLRTSPTQSTEWRHLSAKCWATVNQRLLSLFVSLYPSQQGSIRCLLVANRTQGSFPSKES